MLLESIINGTHSPKTVIIRESSNVKAESVLLKLIKLEAANPRTDLINIVSFQHEPTFFIKDISSHRKVIVHDGYTDPLGWNAVPDCSSEHETEITRFTVSNNLINHIKKSSKDHLKRSEMKIMVIIDGLSLLLRHKSIHDVCTMIKSLSKLTNKVEVVQLVATIQEDIVSQTAINALTYIADATINLELHQRKIPRSNRGFTAEQTSFQADVTLRKKTGKIMREIFVYNISKDLNFMKKNEIEIGAKNEDIISQADPTADLSFNLRLTDSEKQARSQVRLPYTLDNEQKAVQLDPSSGSGQIIYHPDDADDFDEEDPDEDLDI